MYRYGHFVHGPGVFGWLVFALFLALMVVAIVALLRSWRGLGALRPFAAGPQRPSHGVDPALNELRVRYARGDIDWNGSRAPSHQSRLPRGSSRASRHIPGEPRNMGPARWRTSGRHHRQLS